MSATLILMIISAGACIAASFLLAMRYVASVPVGKTVSALNQAAKKLQEYPPCDMNNLDNADKIAHDEFSSVPASRLLESWQWYITDASSLYLRQAVPSPKAYFPFDILAENLRVKNDYARSSFMGVFLSVFSFLICIVIPTFQGQGDDYMTGVGFAVGSLAMLICMLAFIMTTLSYRTKHRNLKIALNNYSISLASRLVGAEAPNNTSLILRSNKEAMESYKQSIDTLANKIDKFVSGQITPAVAETFNKTVAEYIGPALNNLNNSANESLNKLSLEYDKILQSNKEVSSFLNESQKSAAAVAASADTLTQASKETSAMVRDISLRNDEISADITNRLGGLTESITEFTAKLNEGLASNAKTAEELSKAMQRITSIGDEHINESAKTASVIIQSISDETAKMALKTSEAVEALFSKYAMQMTKDVELVMESNSNTAKALAESVIKIDNAGSAQFEKASEVASSMITDISREMRNALQNIGTDVADSIQSAYKENEKYINSLTERTEALVKEYETYFDGMTKNTSNIMADMDFVITGALNRLSTDITEIIDKFNETVSGSAERYETGSRELVMTLSEQTREMGLYAHEINLDVTSLAGNLKDSVTVFNKQMNQGINHTFTEFDKGLAEFTKRMTNTIDAIREAVDGLPTAIALLTQQKK